MERYVLEDATKYGVVDEISGAEIMLEDVLKQAQDKAKSKRYADWQQKLTSAIVANMQENTIYFVGPTADDQITIISRDPIDLAPFKDLYKKITKDAEPWKIYGSVVREFGGAVKYDGKQFSNPDMPEVTISGGIGTFDRPLILTDRGLLIVDPTSFYNRLIDLEGGLQAVMGDGALTLQYADGQQIEIKAKDPELLRMIEAQFKIDYTAAYAAGHSPVLTAE